MWNSHVGTYILSVEWIQTGGEENPAIIIGHV